MQPKAYALLSSFLLLVPLLSAHALITGSAGQIILPTISVAGNETAVFLRLLDQRTGEPLTVDDLSTIHERKIHIFIVGEDLEQFIHTHPEDFPTGMKYAYDGQYHAFVTFPEAGKYAVLANYVGKGQNTILLSTVTVGGLPEMVFEEDLAREKHVGQFDITLEAPRRIVPGEETQFTLRITRNGQPVTTLQQYLGADMHMVITNQNLTNATHLHPYIPGHGIHYGTMAQRYRGPTVPFRHTFAEPGTYALFGQFQENGEVTTVSYMIHVEEPWRVPVKPLILGFLVILGAAALVLLLRTRHE